MASTLDPILAPAAVAIIGASTDPGKRGYRALKRLLDDGFDGPVYPIHPREQAILDVTAYPAIGAVPGPVDLALVCTPAHTLPGIVRECGAKGVKGVVVLAGGLGESGEDGTRLEREIVSAARESGVRVVGPNTSGIFNLHRRLNLVGFDNVRPGPVGVLSQSGNMALALVTEAQAGGDIGFSTYVGVGNQADVRLDEYLDYFAADVHTRAVATYVEGFRDGRRFLETARRTTPQLPVVLFKSGRTEAGQRAARSHTGALAGGYAMTRDLLRQAGIVIAERTDEVLPTAHALAQLPAPAGARVAVLADGGGHATIATDALIAAGLVPAELSAATHERLRDLLLPQASAVNPVDVAGSTDADPRLFADCARAMLGDPGVDLLLMVGLFGGYALRFDERLAGAEAETAARLATLSSELGKPLVMHSLYGDLRPEPLVVLRRGGIPVHASLETAVACVRALVDYGRVRQRPAASPAKPSPRAAAPLNEAAVEGRKALLEPEARRLLAAAGIETTPWALARDENEAASIAERFGEEPLAMKIVSPDVLHKSDAGGVCLNVAGTKAVQQSYRAVMEAVRRHHGDADLRGVLIGPMAPQGTEIIIGVTRDPSFGPVLMFGLGGVFVEVLKDVAFAALPLDRTAAEDLLTRIRAQAMLDGARGSPPVDKTAVVELLLKVSALIEAYPEIESLDLNPVIARSDGLSIVDARVLLR